METQSRPALSDQERWESRRFAAFLVRFAIFVVPLVAGFFAGAAVSHRLPDPETVAQLIQWWVLTIMVASIAATIVDRIARRYLPLSTLLKMTMLFPNEAPSRLKVARRSGSVGELKKRIASVSGGGDRSAGEAAELILSLSAALGRHDRRTRGHSERVRAYVDLIAEELGLSQGDRDRLRWAALLHDIGKLEVSGEILNKDGELDHDEWHEIRQHPIHGVRLIAPIVPWLGEWATTIEHHHERYDGSGYPYGLAGQEIAYGARIVAVADAYDVMTSGRSYQRAKSPETARKEIVALSGVQFDPKVARALMKVALGRLRWATGPLAAVAQLPWSRGLPALGRDVITLLASSALMTTSMVVGIVPAAIDLPSQDVVEVVIAGSGLSGNAVDALVRRPQPDDDSVLAAADPTAQSDVDPDTTGETPTSQTDGSGGSTGPGSSPSTTPGTTPGGGPTTTTVLSSTTTTVVAAIPPTTTTRPPTTTTTPPTTTTTTIPPTTTTTTPPTTTTTTIPPTTTTTTPPTTTTTTIPPTTTTTTPPAVVAVNDSTSVKSNGTANIRVTSNDTGAIDTTSLRITKNPTNGTATVLGASGQIRYESRPGFTGTDSFSYEVCDTSGACDAATVRVTVTN